MRVFEKEELLEEGYIIWRDGETRIYPPSVIDVDITWIVSGGPTGPYYKSFKDLGELRDYFADNGTPTIILKGLQEEMPKIKAIENGAYEEVGRFPSSSNPEKYYTVKRKTETGELSCDCKAWIYVKENKPRTCKHVRLLVDNKKEKTIPTTWDWNRKKGEWEEASSDTRSSAQIAPIPTDKELLEQLERDPDLREKLRNMVEDADYKAGIEPRSSGPKTMTLDDILGGDTTTRTSSSGTRTDSRRRSKRPEPKSQRPNIKKRKIRFDD